MTPNMGETVSLSTAAAAAITLWNEWEDWHHTLQDSVDWGYAHLFNTRTHALADLTYTHTHALADPTYRH